MVLLKTTPCKHPRVEVAYRCNRALISLFVTMWLKLRQFHWFVFKVEILLLILAIPLIDVSSTSKLILSEAMLHFYTIFISES